MFQPSNNNNNPLHPTIIYNTHVGTRINSPHGSRSDEERHGRRAWAQGRAADAATRAAEDRVGTLGRPYARHQLAVQGAVDALPAVARRAAAEARDPWPAAHVFTCKHEFEAVVIVAFWVFLI